MDPLLERQLRRFGVDAESVPEPWRAFLQAVSDAYGAADDDRRRLERSMDLMSKELTERYEELRNDNHNRERVEAALRASEARLRQEIADRERMEVELRLKQKLEAVGQLAAGIAHEINTPVQFVGDSVHFLDAAFEDYRKLLDRFRAELAKICEQEAKAELAGEIREAEEEADLEYLNAQIPKAFARIREGTNRVSSIVGAVKEFAHPDQRTMVPANLNRAIESTLVVARNEYAFVADVETQFGELPEVQCHIGDLNQVFLNLIVNAAHAIADRNEGVEGARGRITITTEADGAEVVVAVRDNGCGIPEMVRDRIFDPFFSTKDVGRGMGQGLAICRSIVVEKHHGTITFESITGEGTTFRIRVPVRSATALEDAA